MFARDLYEAVTGLLAVGDVATARDATRFLFERQQQAAGNMPRNSLLNGKTAPDTGGIQLDETAYPILMAYLTGLSGDASLYTDHIKPAADYLVAHGPSFGNERWEEQGGYSPSTIAAEIAGLPPPPTSPGCTATTPRAALPGGRGRLPAHGQGLHRDPQRPLQRPPYFLRLTKNGDPDSEYIYSLGNGSIDADQRAVVDGGFQELVRLGELPADDADVQNSLTVLDKQLGTSTPTGTGYYRYGTVDSRPAARTGTATATRPTRPPARATVSRGRPRTPARATCGRCSPVSAPSPRWPPATPALARTQLGFMLGSASGVGLVPEQAWEDPDLAASPYGSDPTTASIGFRDGHAAGSAAPLTWGAGPGAPAAGQPLDRPDRRPPRPDHPPVRRPGAAGAGRRHHHLARCRRHGGRPDTVTGTATPGATVDVSLIGNDTARLGPRPRSPPPPTAPGRPRSTALFGSDVITAAATTSSGATGVARVERGRRPGRRDDDPRRHRPGQRRQRAGHLPVPDGGGLQARLVRHHPVPGAPAGRHRLPAHDPARPGRRRSAARTVRSSSTSTSTSPARRRTSTAAAFASRNYTIAPADAWSQRLEVQGFAGPVWQDANGDQVGTVSGVVASPAAKTITIALPAAAARHARLRLVVQRRADRPGRATPPTRPAASRPPRSRTSSASAPRVTRRRSARSTPTACPRPST